MKRIYFFATKADVLAITDTVEQKTAIKYILRRNHLFPEYGDEAPEYRKASQFPSLGVATRRQTILCERYLVAALDAEVRPITRKIGDRQVTAYEAGNCSECVELNAGGVFSEGVLISGLVETWSDSDESQKLIRLFATAVRKEFKSKIKTFWVGREAHELLKQGWRLTQNVDAAPFLDLKITDSACP